MKQDKKVRNERNRSFLNFRSRFDSCRDYKEVDLKVILTFNSTSFILEIVKTAVNPAVNVVVIQ